jgi:hypothetical protein
MFEAVLNKCLCDVEPSKYGYLAIYHRIITIIYDKLNTYNNMNNCQLFSYMDHSTPQFSIMYIKPKEPLTSKSQAKYIN